MSPSYAASRTLHAVAQVIALVLGIVELLLLVRIVLLFFGANPTAEFTSLIYGWSAPSSPRSRASSPMSLAPVVASSTPLPFLP
ncbi:MAG: hypothetical protein ACXVCO_20385 [Ktedonobacterales bacterium]